MIQIKNKKENLLLLFLLVLAFLLRLYKINNPIGDWHAFRQADTASVSREYVKNGINLLIPKYHDLGNIQSGLNNLDGYRMVEFPFINGIIAQVLLAFPIFDLILISRLFSIILSLGTLLSIYFLTKEISNQNTAFLSTLIFAILPYSVYYSRVILPEPFFLFFSTFSIYQFLIFIKKNKFKNFFFSFFSLALSALLKPFVIFLAPVYVSIAIVYQKERALKNIYLYLFPLTFVPLLLWRHHIQQYLSGIPDSDWLFNSNGIRLRPAWFRWLFWERLTKLFLGYFGLIFLFANFLKTKSKKVIIYGSWWLGILAYFIVIATGNVQHDYYQNIMLPILSISSGRGLTLLLNKAKNNIAKIIIFTIAFLSIYFSWQQVKGYFNVNHWDYVRAGAEADRILPKDAKVIAPNFGDTHFLFATNRTGWPIGFEIEDKIKKGAQYYISTNFNNETNSLMLKCQILKRTEEFVIINLQICDFNKDQDSMLFITPTIDDVMM